MPQDTHAPLNPKPEAELPNTLLVGRWVTSFMAFYQGETLEHPPWDPFSWTVNQIAPIIPTNVATLSCFILKPDGTFDGRKGRNTEDGYIEDGLEGTYSVGWQGELGVIGGDIVVRFDDEFSVTLKFLMTDIDEIRFIMAHGPEITDRVPSASGTMHRVADFTGNAPPV